MKMIKKLVNQIDEELESAENYAEKYLEAKAEGKETHYKEMAEDELRHATFIHEEAVAKINNLQAVFTAPVDMQQKWDEEHAHYIEKAAELKRILSL